MKKLSRDEMKNVFGGVNASAGGCTASATCSNGRTYTCAGSTTSFNGSTLGCSGQDGAGVTCYYSENGVTHSSGYTCGSGYAFT
jgi:hypothetical protein